MSSPVNIDSLIFASVTGDICEVVKAYLQAISVIRADLEYRIDEDLDNRPTVEFLTEILRYSPVLYADATNEVNAYAAELTVDFAALSELTGRIIALKIPAENTGTSTLSINELEPIPIVKGSGTALSGGELVSNKVALFLYNGSFHLLNPEIPTARSSVKSTEPYPLPAKGSTQSIPRPEGAKITQAVMVCIEDDGGGYVENDEVDLASVVEDFGSASHSQAFTLYATADAWKFVRATLTADGTRVLNKASGDFFEIDDSKWKLRVDYL